MEVQCRTCIGDSGYTSGVSLANTGPPSVLKVSDTTQCLTLARVHYTVWSLLKSSTYDWLSTSAPQGRSYAVGASVADQYSLGVFLFFCNKMWNIEKSELGCYKLWNDFPFSCGWNKLSKVPKADLRSGHRAKLFLYLKLENTIHMTKIMVVLLYDGILAYVGRTDGLTR
jgi:hypothetical protein